MFVRSILLAVMLLALPALGHGQEQHHVSGELLFSQGDVIVITLLTQDQYRNYKNKSLPPPPFSQIIHLSPEQKTSGRASFVFSGIPRGTYGLVAFRGQGKGPLSSYKLGELNAPWNDIKIEVNKDITGLKVQF